jgi:hypothetical protein
MQPIPNNTPNGRTGRMVKPKSVLYKLMRAALKCGSTLVNIDNTYKSLLYKQRKEGVGTMHNKIRGSPIQAYSNASSG